MKQNMMIDSGGSSTAECELSKNNKSNHCVDMLRKVYELNRRDAAELVRIFKTAGDVENLKRAREDLKRWEDKLQQLA